MLFLVPSGELHSPRRVPVLPLDDESDQSSHSS